MVGEIIPAKPCPWLVASYVGDYDHRVVTYLGSNSMGLRTYLSSNTRYITFIALSLSRL